MQSILYKCSVSPGFLGYAYVVIYNTLDKKKVIIYPSL